MSKVRGNVIDPLDLVRGTTFAEMVAKTLPGAPEAEALAKFKKAYPSAAAMGGGFPAFGADAVRFTLATYPPSNKRIALAPKRIEGHRHFLNKIWNATRLSLELLGDMPWPEERAELTAAGDGPTRGVSAPKGFYNRWIRSRFAAACEAAHDGLDGFRIDEAAHAMYRFFWNDLCDWYLELVKPVLRSARTPAADGVGEGGHDLDPAPLEAGANAAERAGLAPETRATLAYVLEGSLRLLHPLTPFVTEELWQRVPRPRSRRVSIAFGPYPTPEDERAARAPDVDAWMDLLKGCISAARTVRSEHDIDKKAEVAVCFRAANPEVIAFLREHAPAIASLVKTKGAPAFEAPGGPREAGTTVSVVPSGYGSVEVLVALKGLVAPHDELARIERELKKVDKDLAAIDRKVASPGFVSRAPKEVVAETNAQRSSLVDAKARLEAARHLAAEL